MTEFAELNAFDSRQAADEIAVARGDGTGRMPLPVIAPSYARCIFQAAVNVPNGLLVTLAPAVTIRRGAVYAIDIAVPAGATPIWDLLWLTGQKLADATSASRATPVTDLGFETDSSDRLTVKFPSDGLHRVTIWEWEFDAAKINVRVDGALAIEGLGESTVTVTASATARLSAALNLRGLGNSRVSVSAPAAARVASTLLIAGLGNSSVGVAEATQRLSSTLAIGGQGLSRVTVVKPDDVRLIGDLAVAGLAVSRVAVDQAVETFRLLIQDGGTDRLLVEDGEADILLWDD